MLCMIPVISIEIKYLGTLALRQAPSTRRAYQFAAPSYATTLRETSVRRSLNVTIQKIGEFQEAMHAIHIAQGFVYIVARL